MGTLHLRDWLTHVFGSHGSDSLIKEKLAQIDPYNIISLYYK